MSANRSPAVAADDISVEASPLGHLPLVVSLVDKLGITAALDQALPKDGRSKVSDADCVTAMILNILGGRTALYRMEQWTRKLPVQTLIGAHCVPEDFDDARLARTLDNLFEAGTDKLLGDVVRLYLAQPDRPRSYSIHQDSTSIALYGAYEGEAPGWAPQPSRGFSKDHRPDLKQLVFGLSLHGATGLPLVATMFDGNASDHYFNAFHIETLAGLLPSEDDITLVADSKLVEVRTLGALLEQGMHFVSQVPRTFSVRGDAIERLIADGVAPELGRTEARRKDEDPTVYRGRSYDLQFSVLRPGAERTEAVPLRMLAVHSEALAAKFEEALPDLLQKDRASIESAIEKAGKKPFSCDSDAAEASTRICASAKLHKVTLVVESFEVEAKRPRGRPRKDTPPPPPTLGYRLRLDACVPDEGAVEASRRSKTHFVLITDRMNRESYSDAALLAEYRHQHLVEGNCGFRWLKGPAQVAPMFLKSKERIAALGLVFVLALMVRNYLQFTLRAQLAAAGQTVPYYDRKRVTAAPTAEVIWELFSDVVLLTLFMPDSTRHVRLQGMDADKRRVLGLLGLDETILLSRRRKTQDPAGAT